MSLGQSISYAASGYYEGTDGDDNIVAIGFGGNILAKDGDDTIWLGSLAANVYAGGGNDKVNGAAAALNIYDSSGDLTVNGVAAYSRIRKYESGSVSFNGAAGYSEIILREGSYDEPEPDLWQQAWGQIGKGIDAGIEYFATAIASTWQTGLNALISGDVGTAAVSFLIEAPANALRTISSTLSNILGASSSSTFVEYEGGTGDWYSIVPIEQTGKEDWQWADEIDLTGKTIYQGLSMSTSRKIRLEKLLFGGSYGSDGVFTESSSWIVPGADYAGYDTETYAYRTREKTCNWWGSCNTSTTETGTRIAVILFDSRDEYWSYHGYSTAWVPPSLADVMQYLSDSFSSFLAGDGNDYTEFLRRAAASVLLKTDYSNVDASDIGYTDTTANFATSDAMVEVLVNQYLPEDFREAIVQSFIEADARIYLEDWAANSSDISLLERLREFALADIDEGVSHRVITFKGDNRIGETNYDERVRDYLQSDEGLELRTQVYEEVYLNDLKHFESITGVSLKETLGYMGIDISDTAVSVTAVTDALVRLLKTYRASEVAGLAIATALELADAAVNDTTSLYTWFGDDLWELQSEAEDNQLFNQERIDVIASFVKRSVVDTTALMLDMMATAETVFGTSPDTALVGNLKADYDSLAGTNIVTNGGFETLSSTTSDRFSSIQGWTASRELIEIHVNNSRTQEGIAHAEVAGLSNATFYQNVTTQAGQWYTLTFDYSPRNGQADSNALEVWWNDQLIDTIVEDDYTRWRTRRYRVQADGTSAKLAFAGAGTDDGAGMWIDDVSLSEGINIIDYMINTALTQNDTVGTALESRWDDFVDNELVDMAAVYAGLEALMENTVVLELPDDSDIWDYLNASADVIASRRGFVNFTGDYYTNLNAGFTGLDTITGDQLRDAAADADFAFSRKETQINYTDQGWGPSNDNFLVHWQGYFKADITGTYYFQTRADDGTFLKVDGNTLINDWRNQGIVSRTGSVALEAGRRYAVEMYYYEGTGSEDCVLEWSTDQANWETTINSEEDASGADMARMLEAYNDKYLESLVAAAADDPDALQDLKDAFAASLDNHEGQIGVRIGGESYLGNPEYEIYADGELVAEGEVTWAVPSADGESADSMLDTPSAWQTVWFDYAGTPSTITVKMTNDACGGTSGTDRNLWVDKVNLNGDLTEAVEFGSKDINSNSSGQTVILVEPDLAPDVEYSDYLEGHTYGHINYNGAAGYNTISHEFDFGNINFTGVSGYNELTNTGISGDITFNGVSGGNVIKNMVSGEGDVEFDGDGLYNEIVRAGDTGDVTAHMRGAWNTIVHEVDSGDLEVVAFGGYQEITRTGTGTSNLVMVGVANVYSDDGQSDLDIYGFGGANVVTRTGGNGTGDTDAVLGGGLNILTIDNDGDVDAQMYGLGNVFSYSGDGHTDLVMGGAANVATVGDGGSDITALGGANVITTGDGTDNIASFGLANIINSGGAPAGDNDHVEAWGAYNQIDYTNDAGDGISLEVDGLSLIEDYVSEDDRTVEVTTVSSDESQIITEYVGSDPGSQALNNSEISDAGLNLTETEALSGELSEEDRAELESQGIDIAQMENDAQARQDRLDTDYDASDYVNQDGTAVDDYSAGADGFDINSHYNEDHETAIAARDSADLQQLSKDEQGEVTEDAASSTSPIILDMNGNGQLDLTKLSTDILFDMNGDGNREATSWVGTDDQGVADGILLYDKDNDPDNITSDEFVFADTNGQTDMEAAAEEHDDNGDGLLTGIELDGFYVWQDHDTDGEVDTGEVNSAASLNITSINLDTGHTTGADIINGSQVHRTNSFTMNGEEFIVGDVAFKTAAFDEALMGDGFSIQEDLGSSGLYDNLFLAMGIGGIIETGMGDDFILAVAAYNEIHSGGGNDLIIAGAMANNIHAGAGNDVVIAGGLGNYVDLGSGDDVAFVSGFGNLINAGSGNDTIVALPTALVSFISANIVVKVGDGDLTAFLAGMANVIYNEGNGDLIAVMLGLANVVHKTGEGDVIAVLGGAANSVSQKGSVEGDEYIAVMAGALNISTHLGMGDYYVVMVGHTNISTNVLSGSTTSQEVVIMAGMYNVHTTVGETSDSSYIMLGTANVLTKVAPDNDGHTLALMGGTLNIATLVTDGAVTGMFVGGYNIVTRVGSSGTDGDFFAAFIGSFNIATNIADCHDIILMAAYFGNIYTKVGDGDTIAIVIGQGNIITKVGDGDNYVFMGANYGNIFTHVGDGNTMAVMAAVNSSFSANVFTKVGDGDTLALLIANPSSSATVTLNVMTQIGNGRTYALAVGRLNAMIKVGHGDYGSGWGTDPVDGAGLKTLSQDRQQNLTTAVLGYVEDGVDHLSPVLANPYFNTVMVGYGSANIMVEVNAAEFCSGYNDNDGNALDPLTFEERETTTLQAAFAYKGMGNLMAKFGDGAYFGFGITIDPSKESAEYQKAMMWADQARAGGFTDLDLLDESMKVANANRADHVASVLGGNLNIHVGDGDATFFQYGVNNIAFKIGDGGDKSIQIGDNNLHFRIGDAANTPWAFDINGYSAGEGAMFMYGKYNVNFQYGESNDIIIATMPYGGEDVDWEYEGIEGGPSLFSLKEIAQLAAFGTTTKSFDKNFLSKGTNIYHAVSSTLVGQPNAMRDKYTTGALDSSKTKTDAFKEMWGYALEGVKASANIIHAGQGSDIIMVNGGMNLVFADNASSIVDMSIASLLPYELTFLSLDDIVSIFTRGKFDYNQSTGYTSSGTMTGGQKVTENFLLMFNIFQEMGGDLGLFIPSTDFGSVFGVTYNNKGTFNEDFDAQGFLAWCSDWLFAEFKFSDWGMLNSLATQGLTSIVDQIASMANTQHLENAASDAFGIESYTDAINDQSLDDFKDAATYNFERTWGYMPAISAFPNLGYIASVFSNIDEIATLLWEDASDDILDYFTDELGLLTEDGDVIVAKGEANFIFGGHGDDLTIAYGAFNRIYGGDGDDITLSVGNYNCIQSNGGSDISLSWGAQNMLFGDGDADVLIAYGSNNYLKGDGGDDVLIAIGNSNSFSGGSGNNVMIGIGDSNAFFCGDDDDFIFSYGNNNTFYMGGGNDTIINIGSSNTVHWGGGGDIGLTINGDFYGEAGDDYLETSKDCVSNVAEGGSGLDTIVMNGSCASVTGGSDIDTYVLGYEAQIDSLWADTEDIIFLGDMAGYGASGISSANIDNWFTFAKDGGELVITMKDFNGGNDASVVVEDFFALGANYRPDVVLAYWASDTNALNTTRDDAQTNDEDIFSYDYDSIYVEGQYLFDQVNLHNNGAGIDWNSIVKTGEKELKGTTVDSTGLRYAGTDAGQTMDGSAGLDLIYGCAGNDIIYGNFEADILYGNEGDDTLNGNDGDDSLHGNEGDDTLNGNDGDDSLHGNEGYDVLTGGTGADTYCINSIGEGDDTIDNTGREADNDTILFKMANVVKEDLWFTQAGDDLVIEFVGNYGSITVDDWYVESNGTTNNRVAELCIEDTGAVIDADGVDALAQAMASVIASYGGDVTGGDYTGINPNTDDSSLTSLIATTWA